MGADLYLLDNAGVELGYFRDSYGAAMLWMFRLSWWNDVIPLLDEQQYLSVENAKRLLEMLWENEPAFRAELAECGLVAQKRRQQQYDALKALLANAITLNLAVFCSL